ncbi:MAG: serine/threonine protein kinase, partial [Succinivibrionaceae bacterium]|nr:serine/threonine protein kinase [Succinivibrionaceae bacterium]
MKTRINHGASARIIPDLTSQAVAERFAVTSRMNTDSGEADLYRAVDLTNGTDCVIKLYRRSSAVKSGVAGKLKNLNHPGIARLLADGFYGDCYYTVVPYYFGISLDRMIADGRRFKVDELRKNIIPPLVDSLETLHGLGIIHKDLKPANIIITEKEQRPVLIDFGI